MNAAAFDPLDALIAENARDPAAADRLRAAFAQHIARQHLDPTALPSLSKTLFDDNPIPMTISTAEGTASRFLACNAAMLHLLEYDAAEIIGRDMSDFGITVNSAGRLARLKQLDLTGGYDFEAMQIRTRSGKLLDVMVSARRVQWDGRLCDLEVLYDITAQQAALDRLSMRDTQIRVIAENIRDLIALLELDGTVTYTNPALRLMLDYPTEALHGQNGFDFIHPDDREAFFYKLEAALRNGIMHKIDTVRLRRADGVYIQLEAQGNFSFNADGTPNSIVVTLRDVSERDRLRQMEFEEEHLRRTLAKEHELNELKTRMMGRIAHEFRTPLAIISTSTDLLNRFRGRLTDDQISTHYRKVQTEIAHLAKMLDTIALAVRGQSNLLHLNVNPFDLADICRQTAEASREKETTGHPITFTADDPPHPISADAQLIRTLLLRLLTNAAKFSSLNAPIVVNVTKHEAAYTISVRDQGIGIPLAEQGRIFDPFFRASNAGSTSGIGLGLAIAHQITRAHGGFITVASEINVGTTMNVHLPLTPDKVLV